jgi:hypothetical protein
MQGGYTMKRLSLAVAVVLGAVLLGSCLDFFTNPIGGDVLVRTDLKVKVTPENVKGLLRDAKGDTESSKAILSALKDELKGNSNPNPVLQAAVIKAANQSAGLGEEILGSIGTVLSGDVSGDAFTELLTGITSKDLTGISDDVTASLSGAIVTLEGAPTLTGAFLDEPSESDLALLTFTLILAEVEKTGGTFDSYIASWGDGKKLDGTGTVTLSDSEELIAALGNQLVNNPNSEIGKQIQGLLG